MSTNSRAPTRNTTRTLLQCPEGSLFYCIIIRDESRGGFFMGWIDGGYLAERDPPLALTGDGACFPSLPPSSRGLASSCRAPGRPAAMLSLARIYHSPRVGSSCLAEGQGRYPLLSSSLPPCSWETTLPLSRTSPLPLRWFSCTTKKTGGKFGFRIRGNGRLAWLLVGPAWAALEAVFCPRPISNAP